MGAGGGGFSSVGPPNRQKSSSESNLLEMGGSDPFHSFMDTLQPETNPSLHHASSSGAVNNQGDFLKISMCGYPVL